MTLCIAWRRNEVVHFASDSRLTLGASYADVAIKVSTLPYRIYEPYDETTGDRKLAIAGELGMCFAGTAVNSLFVKESVAEVLRELQYAPGYTDVSMKGIANFLFSAYKVISRQVCSTVLGEKGRATIVIGGYCAMEKRTRVFLFETNHVNQHSCTEILLKDQHVLIGSGIAAAESALPAKPSDCDYLKALKSVIDNPDVETVGGAIQYGRFQEKGFRINGVTEVTNNHVHYWRGALDLNDSEFIGQMDALIPAYRYIDLSRVFEK